MKKRFIVLAVLLLTVLIAWGIIYLNSLLPIVTGYPAKYLCSAVFVSGRNAEEVEERELSFSLVQFAKNTVDYTQKTVTSRFLWSESEAVYLEGFGSRLTRVAGDLKIRRIQFPVLPPGGVDPDTLDWPAGNRVPAVPESPERKALQTISDRLINQKAYGGNAYAFLVVHGGNLVAEAYAPGFDSAALLQSWSMAKSFTGAMAGAMVMDGLLDTLEPAGLPEWQGDDRRLITVGHLLRMQSGLDWNEEYGNRSDVTLMLYKYGDMAGYASEKKAAFAPGTKWYYSSGSTNILSRVMRRHFSSDSAYHAYPHVRLFRKTGIRRAVFETDMAGTYIGSSYLYVTARDYARFGLLYLHDGVFEGERVLPEGWVKYTASAVNGSEGQYGSSFWLNRGLSMPEAPADMLYCNGHDGQRIFILPSNDLVIVILGYSPKPDGVMEFGRLVGDVVKAIN